MSFSSLSSPLPGRSHSPSPYHVLKTCSQYRKYWLGQVVSQTGYWMQVTATGWLVLSLTGSAKALGMVTFLQFLPALLLSLPSGTLADLYSRKAVMVCSQTASLGCAVTLTILTLAGSVEYWHVLLIAGASGTAAALGLPAKQAFGVDLAGKENISAVSALSSLYINVARLVGPAIAGVSIVYWGLGWNFLANAVSYLPLIAVLVTASPAERPQALKTRGIVAFKAGLQYVLAERDIRRAGVALFFTATLGINMTSLIPAYARFVLNLEADRYGLLFACTGLGACVGAWCFGSRGAGRLGTVQLASAGLALCYLLLAAPLAFEVCCVIFAIAGSLIVTVLVHSNSIFQRHANSEMRGRVMAVYSLLVLGSNPLGAMLVGNLFDNFGGRVAVIILGGLILQVTAVAVVWYRFWSRDVALEQASGGPGLSV